MDGEAREVVVGVGEQTERAAVGRQDIADEQQTEALALGLGGVERGEQMLGHLGRDASPVVGDHELIGCGGDGDVVQRHNGGRI